MEPKTLSASSALVFEGCEARFKAENIDRGKTMGGTAANLGTACHEALELWVKNGDYLAGSPFDTMVGYYDHAYHKLFTDDSRFDEGVEMLKNWYGRQNWEGRTVLSTELKETFDLPTSAGIIPFTYIWDRCDRLDDGTIEVVDYKSVIAPVSPDDLKTRIQPRAYALAAQMKYPDAKAIWVAFDLLRYDVVATKFTRDDNVATWKYLKELAERLLASDGTKETLNPECRWCVRKTVCDELVRHAAVGGTLGLTDPTDAADKRSRLDMAKAAITAAVAELDTVILGHMEENELTEYVTPETQVFASARGTRTVDTERVEKIVGSDMLVKYGKLGITQFDAMLKQEDLTAGQKSQLKQVVRKTFGKISVKTKPVHPFGDDD